MFRRYFKLIIAKYIWNIFWLHFFKTFRVTSYCLLFFLTFTILFLKLNLLWEIKICTGDGRWQWLEKSQKYVTYYLNGPYNSNATVALRTIMLQTKSFSNNSQLHGQICRFPCYMLYQKQIWISGTFNYFQDLSHRKKYINHLNISALCEQYFLNRSALLVRYVDMATATFSRYTKYITKKLQIKRQQITRSSCIDIYICAKNTNYILLLLTKQSADVMSFKHNISQMSLKKFIAIQIIY
jgi:hypothetical protein